MATLAEIKLQIIRLLGEEQGSEYPSPVAGTNTVSDLLVDAVHAALMSLSSRYWKSSVSVIDADENELVFSLPSDLIAIDGVYDDALSVFIPKTLFQVGYPLTRSDNDWIEYPEGNITFSNPMTSGGKLFYSAHWELPTQDDDVVEAPNMCLTYIVLYATSYCLLKNANSQAELRQFATKVDSGTPVMLPAKDMSDYFMRRAEIELARLPIKQKGIV